MINLLNSGLKRNKRKSMTSNSGSHAFLSLKNMGGGKLAVKGDNKQERWDRDGGYCK
jgi:hypothetical protein